MKRILHFVSSLGIGNGITNFIMNYYRNMSRDKIQFDFLYFDEQTLEFKNEIEKLGGNTYLLKRPTSLQHINQYKKFFEENGDKYIAFHNHEGYMNFFLASQAKKSNIKYVIVHSHVTKYSDKFLNAMRNGILCSLIKYNTDYFFACSKTAGEFMYGKRMYKKGKITIINNAIDYSKYKDEIENKNRIRNNYGISSDDFVVGHIGRMTPQKNHKSIINIFYEIQKRKNKSLLVLVGDGYLKDEIIRQIADLGLDANVLFLGERNDINQILQLFDVFLFPSVYEGLGIAVIEAQVAGIPCFVSDKVPKEAYISDWIYGIGLKLEPSLWAEFIVEHYNDLINNRSKDNKLSMDYNINNQSDKLEKFYLGL